MRLAPLLLAALAAACAHAPAPPPADPAASLAAAETAFAAQSVREGMHEAFLAHFADDGVLVHGGWTNALAYLRQRPAAPIVLDWRPAYVEVAASGELGLSTGPWQLTRPAKPGAGAAYGQFVSVWRRDGGGTWKVAVDVGISHPAPALWDEPLHAVPAGGNGASPATLDAAEDSFARQALREGTRAAYEHLASRTLRLYREGASPALGRAAALASPAMGEGPYAWKAQRMETARSGDLGYARGTYAAASGPDVAQGVYLRVWRLEGGAWRIALDVANPQQP